MNLAAFQSVFSTLTGNDPFPWQEELFFEWFSKGQIPKVCDLPTGLGKTSVVTLWLIALAWHPEKMPRRLVYIVNRRTVVDQTTDEVTYLQEKLADAGLKAPLDKLCTVAGKLPLAVSTLRGQLADNREWSTDPCRPAIIVGTVDMIGSRLLFSGYGRLGRYSRSLHAGLLGQDTLIILDEAHLCPVFEATLRQALKENQRWPAIRPSYVLSLSATQSGSDAVAPSDLFALDEERLLKRDALDWRRVHAKKALRFLPAPEPTE